MKKLLSIFLVLVAVVSFAACGNKTTVEETLGEENVVETEKKEEIAQDNDKTEEKEAEKKEDPKKEETKKDEPKKEKPVKEEIKKEEVKEDKKEESKKEEPKKEESKKEEPKKEEEKPAEKPEETPAPETTTLGKTLLADFKAKAGSGMGAQEIAESLLSNPAIKFGGGAMPVEEGLLSGFDNTEIRGFKSGVMFAPMIGSIPFVGYVFEVDNSADIPAFVSTLEKSANLRWNICVEADEMVTGSADNKVFFVMCPTTLED